MTGQGEPRRYKPKRYRITFDDGHEYAGLEVTCKAVSLDVLIGMMSAADSLGSISSGQMTDADRQAFRDIVCHLASVIVSWNVDDDDDQPVAPDAAGLMGQELGMVLAITTALTERVASVAPPLPQGSPNGQAGDIESLLPMEPLPASPAS